MQSNIEDFFSIRGPRNQKPDSKNNRNKKPTQYQRDPAIQKEYLRLTHHTRNLWNFVKPRLTSIVDLSRSATEDILETICDFSVESRLCFRQHLNISLLAMFIEEIGETEFNRTCILIANWALESEFLFPYPILISQTLSNSSIDLTLQQIRSILSLMFFCCLPKQEKQLDLPPEYTFYNMYNFNSFNHPQIEKLKCIFNYFRRAEHISLQEKITFKRLFEYRFHDWEQDSTILGPVLIDEEKISIDEFRDGLMVDFANKYIGGGVLSHGTVQEEILFLNHVEPLVSLIFTEKLENEEAFLIIGAERYNLTTGYKENFKWVTDFSENIRLDSHNRNDNTIVAIDALVFRRQEETQYSMRNILRELNKAFIGFKGDPDEVFRKTVVTGRWGCGAFNGDEELKFIIQWLAATAAEREMRFLPWEMKDIAKLKRVVELVECLAVRDVVELLRSREISFRVFDYLINKLS